MLVFWLLLLLLLFEDSTSGILVANAGYVRDFVQSKERRIEVKRAGREEYSKGNEEKTVENAWTQSGGQNSHGQDVGLVSVRQRLRYS